MGKGFPMLSRRPPSGLAVKCPSPDVCACWLQIYQAHGDLEHCEDHLKGPILKYLYARMLLVDRAQGMQCSGMLWCVWGVLMDRLHDGLLISETWVLAQRWGNWPTGVRSLLFCVVSLARVSLTPPTPPNLSVFLKGERVGSSQRVCMLLWVCWSEVAPSYSQECLNKKTKYTKKMFEWFICWAFISLWRAKHSAALHHL